MIRCAKSDCYRGRNGQNHEPTDTQGSIDQAAAAVSNGGNGAQDKAAGSSPGAIEVSSQSSDPGFACADGGTGAADFLPRTDEALLVVARPDARVVVRQREHELLAVEAHARDVDALLAVAQVGGPAIVAPLESKSESEPSARHGKPSVPDGLLDRESLSRDLREDEEERE